MCLQSLVEEITFNAGHLLAREEPQTEDHPEAPKLPVMKPGRGFCHALTKLYIHEAGLYANVAFSSFSMVKPLIVEPLLTKPVVVLLCTYLYTGL